MVLIADESEVSCLSLFELSIDVHFVKTIARVNMYITCRMFIKMPYNIKYTKFPTLIFIANFAQQSGMWLKGRILYFQLFQLLKAIRMAQGCHDNRFRNYHSSLSSGL